MFTNTFTPHVGGVAASVSAFAMACRARGHRVLVVAPELPDAPRHEEDVVRVPALQHFNGTDFAMPLPVPGLLRSTLARFEPDLVHAHHPFLLGDTGLRVAATWNLPVLFTHHTQYEKYTHYVPGDSTALQRFVSDLATGYANLADAVVAPSASIAGLLRAEGVTRPIAVIPTGIDPRVFAPGPRAPGRERLGIPADAFVIGHVGRLAPEKNLAFMTQAVTRLMAGCPRAHFLVVGAGPSATGIRTRVAALGLGDRLHMPGVVRDGALVDAYRAMDVFAFASHTETQGLVLAEALACGVPVVAVDAPGVREVVRHGVNGALIPDDDAVVFARALFRIARLPEQKRAALGRRALESAGPFSLEGATDRLVALYTTLSGRGRPEQAGPDSLWAASIRRIRREVDILSNLAGAAGDAMFGHGLETAC